MCDTVNLCGSNYGNGNWNEIITQNQVMTVSG